jgi:hypothetical protein
MEHAHATDTEPGPTPTAATLTLFDPVIVEEVPIEWWRKVFAIAGYPAGLSTKNLTHPKIIELAPTAADNVRLWDFIQALHDLGSEDGTESIFLAAQTSGFSTEGWPANEVPRVRAVRLWVEQHQNERLRQVMLASQVHAVERGRRPPVHEFVGQSASTVRHRPKDLERAIEDAMHEVCDIHLLGTHVEARVRADDDELVCHIVHGSRLLQPMAETKEGGRRLLVYRPVQVDTVRYEFETARLKISCRSATLVPSIQELFGKVLFGDPKFFQNGEACTLEPLRRGEVALAAHEVSTITGAKLVQASFRFGKHRLQMRGPDCFEHMKQIGFRVGESELYEGKIEIRFAGRKVEKCSVLVRAPNRIDFKRDAHEKDVERYLEQIGVRIVADKQSDQNLWTLFPWRHPLSRWRAVLGGEADRACREGILKSIGLEFVRRPDRQGDPNPIEVVDVGGVRVGISADEDVGARVLSDTDIQGMELDFGKLTNEIARSLSLVEGAMRLEHEGFADLGKRALGSTEIRVFLMAREPTADRPAVARRIRATAGTAHPVVIVPPGLSAGTGLLEVEQLVPSSGYEHVLRAAVAELRLESQVPAIEFAPRDRRLVVDEVFSKVWLDGLPLEALKAGDQPYKLIAALAAAGGACVGRTELAGILSPARTDEGGPKMAKSRLLKAIAASMKAAGRTPLKPADVLRQETGGGGYRLCLSCWYRPASASR